jgi:hypothetical protein
MGYIIIRGVAEGAIENQLQETGDLIIDPTNYWRKLKYCRSRPVVIINSRIQ